MMAGRWPLALRLKPFMGFHLQFIYHLQFRARLQSFLPPLFLE